MRGRARRAEDAAPGVVVVRPLRDGDAVRLRSDVEGALRVKGQGARLVVRQAVGAGEIGPGISRLRVAGEAAVGRHPHVAVGGAGREGEDAPAERPGHTVVVLPGLPVEDGDAVALTARPDAAFGVA